MLNVQMSVEENMTQFTFTNRGVNYSIFPDANNADQFTVFTNRESLGPRALNIKVMTREEMDHGPKVYQEFLAVLEMAELGV